MQSERIQAPAEHDQNPDLMSGRLCQVYSAAASLFFSHSFQSVSVKQIAISAGVPPGSLHKLVGSKDELRYKLFLRFESDLLEEIQLNLPSSLDSLSAMRRFAEVYVKYGAARRDELLLVRRDFHSLSPAHQDALKIVRDKLVTRLWEITAIGQAKKIFRFPDLRFSAKVILATLEGTLANRTLTSAQILDSIPLLQVMIVQFASAGRRL